LEQLMQKSSAKKERRANLGSFIVYDRMLAGSVKDEIAPDELSRQVYCVLGMPIDLVEMSAVLHAIKIAAARKLPFLISTPNLNFLVNYQIDTDFRESVLSSDLCPADGISIVWIARLVGIPITKRISGADIFDALKCQRSSENPLKVFLFGGPEGVAARAAQVLNEQPNGLNCVGALYPGCSSVGEMSRDEMINNINSSGADFLVAALGAKKGQLWLQHNHKRLSIPVRAHLGAVINFEAGTIRRAPLIVQMLGFEWLWRIKEEPYLWRRYWNDGMTLLRVLLLRILPLALHMLWQRLKYDRNGHNLVVTQTHDSESVTVSFSGPAIARHVNEAIPVLRSVVGLKKRIVIDFSGTLAIDTRFLGLFLMLRKKVQGDRGLTFTGLSPRLERIFCLNGLGLLLSTGKSS